MKRSLVAFACATGLSFGLVSCGGESELSGAGGQIDATTMAQLLGTTAITDMMAAIVPTGTGDVTLPVQGLPGGIGTFSAFKTQAATFDACTTTTGSKTTDADTDGVPASYREEYNCSGVSTGAGVSNLLGHMQVTDSDDTKYGLRGGYNFDFDITYEDVMSHETNYGNWGGTWGASFSGSTYTMASKYFYEAGSTPSDGSPTSAWKASHQFTSSYTADDVAQPWESGTMSMNGFSRFSGSLYDQAMGQSYTLDVTFKIEANGLVYDRTACTDDFFKDGTLTFTDGSGNVFKYEYSNCTATRTFNGTSI